MTKLSQDMNAKSKLKVQEDQLRSCGVVDIKFFFNRSNKPLTGVVADVVDVLEAVLQKRFDKAQQLGDSARNN